MSKDPRFITDIIDDIKETTDLMVKCRDAENDYDLMMELEEYHGDGIFLILKDNGKRLRKLTNELLERM